MNTPNFLIEKSTWLLGWGGLRETKNKKYARSWFTLAKTKTKIGKQRGASRINRGKLFPFILGPKVGAPCGGKAQETRNKEQGTRNKEQATPTKTGPDCGMDESYQKESVINEVRTRNTKIGGEICQWSDPRGEIFEIKSKTKNQKLWLALRNSWWRGTNNCWHVLSWQWAVGCVWNPVLEVIRWSMMT